MKALLSSGRIVLLISSTPADPTQQPEHFWMHVSLVYRKPYDVVGLLLAQEDPHPTEAMPPYPATAVLRSSPMIPLDAWELFERGSSRKSVSMAVTGECLLLVGLGPRA